MTANTSTLSRSLAPGQAQEDSTFAKDTMHRSPLINTLTSFLILLTVSCQTTQVPEEESQPFQLTSNDVALLRRCGAIYATYRYTEGDNGRFFHEVGANDAMDDRGLALIGAKMPNLKTLSLQSCQRVTDAGVADIAVLEQLQTLSLDRTQITDASVTNLIKLSNLRDLNISGTKISASGIYTLAKELESVFITAGSSNISEMDKADLSRKFGNRVRFD